MAHSFIAVNNFWLCRLSPSDGEISLFWFNSPRLTVSANNLPVLEKHSEAPRQNSSSQIIRSTPLALYFFCDCFFKKFLLREVFYLT